MRSTTNSSVLLATGSWLTPPTSNVTETVFWIAVPASVPSARAGFALRATSATVLTAPSSLLVRVMVLDPSGYAPAIDPPAGSGGLPRSADDGLI